jgi:murein DD-endopeptidase MepM/ murein hydrolase activator NlpD
LGVMGSSVNSSSPHLHFEVKDADATVINPYAGVLSQERSWWVEQSDDPETLPAGQCSR